MNKTELKRLVGDTLKGAILNLNRDGSLTHFALLFTPKPGVVALQLDDVDRDVQPRLLQLAEKKTPDWICVVHVSEAWFVERDAASDVVTFMPPSRCADRKECVVVEAKNRSGDMIAVRQVFGRDEAGKPVLEGKPQWWTDGKYQSRILGIKADV